MDHHKAVQGKCVEALRTKIKYYRNEGIVCRLQSAALLDPCNVFKVGFTEDEKIKSLKKCILDLHDKDSEGSQSEIPSMPGQEMANISSVTLNSSRPTLSKSFESPRLSMSQSCDSDKPAVLQEFTGH